MNYEFRIGIENYLVRETLRLCCPHTGASDGVKQQSCEVIEALVFGGHQLLLLLFLPIIYVPLLGAEVVLAAVPRVGEGARLRAAEGRHVALQGCDVTRDVSRVMSHLLGPLPRPQRVEDGLYGGLGVVLRPLTRPVAVHLADVVTRLRVQSSCWGWGGPCEVCHISNQYPLQRLFRYLIF